MNSQKISILRLRINENLRVQKGGADPIPYIDIGNIIGDMTSRQNHAVFGRRGCGKTLLLNHVANNLPKDIKSVYINLEDFKRHSFPNVLIEILDSVFNSLERHLTGWFGKKRRSKEIIKEIRSQLQELRTKEDSQERTIRESSNLVSDKKDGGQLTFDLDVISGSAADSLSVTKAKSREERYRITSNKIKELDIRLPHIKQKIRELFELANDINAVFIELDDFYHLSKIDQPMVMDYIHRLCKDVPLFFKVATLRHASTLYADRDGQPIGAQERHDYQSINVDFTLGDFHRTAQKNKKILAEFGKMADMSTTEIDALFKGEGFNRLVMAGGGVPRDFLSLFLEIIERMDTSAPDARIGKDEVRQLSHANFERRIEELKQDSEGIEQGPLIRGIYVLRQFCISEKKTNIFLVNESVLQQNANIRALLYRLLDYRIIHSAASAITHKSQSGTYQAFAIDIGCYAHMRVLDKRFTEIDLSDSDAKEKMRSAPILDDKYFTILWKSSPTDIEHALNAQSASLSPVEVTQTPEAT